MGRKKEETIKDLRSVKAGRMMVVEVIEGGPLFNVHSPDSGSDYQVYRQDGYASTCTCPDFKHRHDKSKKFRCAHIRAVELWKVKQDLGLEDIIIVDRKDLE